MSKAYRVGVKGYNGSSLAEYLDDVTVGAFCMWVEFPNGSRVEGEDLRAVRFDVEGVQENTDPVGITTLEFSSNSAHPKMELETFRPLEIVYVNGDGEPLTYREASE